MALIKCIECGKEFSDKANACPNCACPIEKNTKIELEYSNDNEEVEIIRTTIDEKQINFYANLILVCIGLLWLVFIFIILLFGSNSIIDIIVLPIIITAIFIPISISFRLEKEAYLVLTNKRIYGQLKRMFATYEIDFPLSKISSITKFISMKQQNITIEATGSTKYTIEYVSNADEFRQEFLKIKK